LREWCLGAPVDGWVWTARHASGVPMTGKTVHSLGIDALDVLVVDDNPGARQIILTILRGFGCQSVRTAADGLEALGLIRRRLPDLVVADWHMAPMSGVELAKRLRRSHNPKVSGVPIILATGDASRRTVEAARAAGIDQFVVKPIVPLKLGERIAWVLANRTALDQVEGAAETLRAAEPVRDTWYID